MGARSKFLDPNAVPLRRKPGGNIWARLVKLAQVALFVALSALLLICFLPVLHKVENLKQQKEILKRQVALEQDENRQLNKRFELIRSNPDYVERIARDKLNLGKPGEIIFRFDAYADARPVSETIGSAPRSSARP